MAPRRTGLALRCRALGLAWAVATSCAAGLLGAARGFVAAAPPRAAVRSARGGYPHVVARQAVEVGKVNLAEKQAVRDYLLGEESGFAKSATAAAEWNDLPTLECDEACVSAIEDCLEGGCSVEAIQKLDEALAEDEAKVSASLKSKRSAWRANFLSRTGALRAQLAAIVNKKGDLSFGEQLIKAAAVAFGASRPNDYPKSGVSPYQA